MKKRVALALVLMLAAFILGTLVGPALLVYDEATDEVTLPWTK